jgi:P4 family phage/plasmid primase-like protien
MSTATQSVGLATEADGTTELAQSKLKNECPSAIIPLGSEPKWPGVVPERELPKFHMAGRDFRALNYEAATLSCLLNYPDKIVDFSNGLSTEHFYDKHNRDLYFAIVHLHNRGVVITADAVLQYFQDTDVGHVLQWLEYIDAISAVAVDPDHVSGYKSRLAEAVRLRGGDSFCLHSFSEAFCAELLQLRTPNVCCVGSIWLEYAEGVWMKKDRNLFRKVAREVIHPNQVQARRIIDVLSSVESAKQVSADDFCGAYKMVDDRVVINVNNGVVEVTCDGMITFRDHSADDRFTLKLAADYSPGASSPHFKKLVTEALPDPQDAMLLQCFSGYILYPLCSYEACLVCWGMGQTGKSSVAHGLRSTLGNDLCGSVELDVLCNGSSYSLPGLKLKMLNLGSELKGSDIEESSNFKKLVSGEHLNARAIYAAPEEMATTAKLMFLSNHVPRFTGGTDAELRRMRMLEFSHKPAVKDLRLKSKLKGEISGILNWMLEGLVMLLEQDEMPRGGGASEALLDVFSKSNDPVGRFVDECCVLDPRGEVNKNVLVAGFKEWCEVNNIVIALDKIDSFFFKTLKKRFPKLKYFRRRMGGRVKNQEPERLRFVLGIRLPKNPPTLMPKEVGEEFEDVAALLGHAAVVVEPRPRAVGKHEIIGPKPRKLPNLNV